MANYGIREKLGLEHEDLDDRRNFKMRRGMASKTKKWGATKFAFCPACTH